MTNYEWDSHKAKWCERCKHNTRRGGGCPAFAIMERMPDDVATNILFMLGKCSQYEVKPKRPKKQKAADSASR